MRIAVLGMALALAAVLAGCGGDKPVKVDCDKPGRYQSATLGKRLEIPEGLDGLNEFNEMPIPKADDGAPVPPPGQCIDMPPAIGSS